MNDYDWAALRDTLTQEAPTVHKRPLIGITGNYGAKGLELAEGYFRSVYEAGGVPVAIPPIDSVRDVERLLWSVDGLIFSGGGDIDARFINEEPSPTLSAVLPERDRLELGLLARALEKNIPMLCICRGIQLLAIVSGGRLLQDLGENAALFPNGLLNHSQPFARAESSHVVTLDQGSLIADLLSGAAILTNSFHHQAAGGVGNSLRIVGRSLDGVIEAVESSSYKPVIGVQWHPETYILAGDRRMLPLFEWLTGEASTYSRARSLHNRILTLDSHCDTPMCMEEGDVFASACPRMRVSLPRMHDGGLKVAVFAAYLPQRKLNDAGFANAYNRCVALLDSIDAQVGETAVAAVATSPEGLKATLAAGRKVILKAIENGYALAHSLDKFRYFASRGIVYLTLCHNGDNDICDAAVCSEHTHGGLSPFGRELVCEMNRAGVLIDLSHAGDETFWQVLQLSQQPVVCTHSSCRALCGHPRNLTDEQLRALAERGGVCQVNAYCDFINNDGSHATVEDYVLHILHAIDVAGIEHVGIGSDFDGGGGIPGFDNAADSVNLTRLLIRAGLSDDELSLLWGRNFFRVWQQVYNSKL